MRRFFGCSLLIMRGVGMNLASLLENKAVALATNITVLMNETLRPRNMLLDALSDRLSAAPRWKCGYIFEWWKDSCVRVIPGWNEGRLRCSAGE